MVFATHLRCTLEHNIAFRLEFTLLHLTPQDVVEPSPKVDLSEKRRPLFEVRICIPPHLSLWIHVHGIIYNSYNVGMFTHVQVHPCMHACV